MEEFTEPIVKPKPEVKVEESAEKKCDDTEKTKEAKEPTEVAEATTSEEDKAEGSAAEATEAQIKDKDGDDKTDDHNEAEDAEKVAEVDITPQNEEDKNTPEEKIDAKVSENMFIAHRYFVVIFTYFGLKNELDKLSVYCFCC